MDRRKFIGISAAGALAAAGEKVMAMVPGTDRAVGTSRKSASDGLHIKFLGTGAGGGIGKDRAWRRHSSILVDNTFLIDLTAESVDLIPEGVKPEIIFYTHSHRDHFDPPTAVRLGIKTVYLSSTLYNIASKEFREAAKELDLPRPEIIPLSIGCTVAVGDVRLTPIPANHATDHLMEQSLNYLIQKGSTRILYATDTSGLTGVGTKLIGVNPDGVKSTGPNPLTGLIMESTMGPDHEVDFRLFQHSSTALVERTAKVLTDNGLLHLPEGGHVWLTHMARSLWGPLDKANDGLPSPLRAASDGLELIL